MPPIPNRFLAALRSIPAGARILAVLVAGMMVAFLVAKDRAEARRANVGESCGIDTDCHSELCASLRGGPICTKRCEQDTECPSEMHCDTFCLPR